MFGSPWSHLPQADELSSKEEQRESKSTYVRALTIADTLIWKRQYSFQSR